MPSKEDRGGVPAKTPAPKPPVSRTRSAKQCDSLAAELRCRIGRVANVTWGVGVQKIPLVTRGKVVSVNSKSVTIQEKPKAQTFIPLVFIVRWCP